MTVKLITFDLDDTLWDNIVVIKEAVKQCYGWLLENYPKLADHYDIDGLNALNHLFHKEWPEFKHQLSRARIIGMEVALEQAGYSRYEIVTGAEEAFEIFSQWRRRVVYYPGVIETLKYLDEHYTLAALTNGNITMEALRIDRFFDFVLKGEDLNSSKPDPLMYQMAMKMAGATSEEMLHVGDNPENDILAAKKLGILTVWFNPQNETWEHDLSPDYIITSIPELKDIMTQLCVS
jgi:putative hydrolase of the HAD superfamily